MTTYKDTDLREALRRMYADTPPMPEGLNERLMQRMASQEKDHQVRQLKSKTARRRWLYPIIAAVAASMLLLLTFHYNPREDTVVARKTEPTIVNVQEPVTAQETPVVADFKRPRPAVISHSRKIANPAKQKAKDAEHILKQLDEADMAFSQATVQCAIDIEESIPLSEEQEGTDRETDIII